MTEDQNIVAVNIKAGLFPYSDGSGYQLEIRAEYIPDQENTLTLSKYTDQEVNFDIDQWEIVREAIDDMVSKVRAAQERKK